MDVWYVPWQEGYCRPVEAGENVCRSMCVKQGRMSVGQYVGSRGECLLVNVCEAGENVCWSICGKQGRMSVCHCV